MRKRKIVSACLARRSGCDQADFIADGPAVGVGDIQPRRGFPPIQYSETPLEAALTPNVVATALLDVTNPDGKAVGYEIRLVTP